MNKQILVAWLVGLGPFLSAGPIIFKANYDVYWRGWQCGTMHAQLEQTDSPEIYHYYQTIQSSVWFFNFTQQESSRFTFKNKGLQPLVYSMQKEQRQSDRQSYTLAFNENDVTLIDKESVTEHHIDIVYPCFDRLLLQIQMMLLLGHKSYDHLSLSHVDHHGFHHYNYEVTSDQPEAVVVSSTQRNRLNVFVLSPEYDYLPIKFEQLKQAKTLLAGELHSVEFDRERWQNFQKAYQHVQQ